MKAIKAQYFTRAGLKFYQLSYMSFLWNNFATRKTNNLAVGVFSNYDALRQFIIFVIMFQLEKKDILITDEIFIIIKDIPYHICSLKALNINIRGKVLF